MVRLLIASALALSGPAQAEEWKPHQVALGAIAMTMHMIDWGQTRHIAATNDPDYRGYRYVEKGPIARHVIGEIPSRSRVDAYFLLTGALLFGAAHFLPEYRTAILSAWAAERFMVVLSNHEIGLRVGGSF